MAKTVAALVVAAGRGARLATPDNKQPKQYRLLAGRPVLTHTLNTLAKHPRISRIVTVIHPGDTNLYRDAIAALPTEHLKKLLPEVPGGDTRQKSVFEGLRALSGKSCDYVLIHDAARPFVTFDIIDSLVHSLESGTEGALAASRIADTLKRSQGNGKPLVTVDRSNLWAAQTPQAFPYRLILDAHEKAASVNRHDFTDDTSLAEWNKMTIQLCESDPGNFKITTMADLNRAERQAKILTMNEQVSAATPLSTLQDIRTGIGYDVHAFDEGEKVVLGGVEIPHTRKLKGHSDADVVLHAITDATLGAIGCGDIGQHFPPSAPQWKEASSDRFQRDAMRRVSDLGGRIAHIDVTIVCEEPKIGPHRDRIRKSIAQICDISEA
ncbi:MAG: 2-C-methyl-D-erythritol 4-phosphate cytidylyltransferase, partial [Pseudomonadota bacterium]